MIPTDEFDRDPWVFEAAVTEPNRRVRVQVTVTLHAQSGDSLAGDCAEIAQVTAKRAMDQVQKIRNGFDEEPPF